MKIKSTLIALSVLCMVSCGKETIEPEPQPEPEAVADAQAASHFYDASTPYYQLFIYRFDASENTWTRRIGGHFPMISEDDPTYLGFAQIYVENSGVNLFHMVTLYQEILGTNNLKTVGINVDKVLQFFPDAATETEPNPKTGTVKVHQQDVKLYKAGDIEDRTKMDFILIGISGEGTYDLEQGLIDLDVHFDETKIGGPAKITHTFKISTTALTF